MAIDLSNSHGDTLRVSAGHWAVYLSLAQAFGWKPKGTFRPTALAVGVEWSGRYDSSDGQVVSDAEAKLLAEVLHAAAVNPEIGRALFDVIAHVEGEVEKSGVRIPPALRMHPNDFRNELSPLLMFLYKGEFVIE